MNISHDYILVYTKPDCCDFNNITERILDTTKIKKDKNGSYLEGDTKAILASLTQGYSKGGDYDFEYNGKIYKPITSSGQRHRWLWTYDRMEAAAKLGILVETKNTLRMQVYLDKSFEVGTNILVNKAEKLKFHTADFMSDNKFTNTTGKKEIGEIFGTNIIFDYPKPKSLISKLLELATDENSIILDSFAGSGTLAHAVLELNKKDGGNRKFILVEMEDYAENITAERVRRVIKGYGKEPESSATGGDFGFYELGEVLFLENGNINENIESNKIKEYIYYIQTKQKYIESDGDLLGIHNNIAYYFIYKKDEITILDFEYLAKLIKADSYVIYADKCYLSKEQLNKNNIEFKQIPRDIEKI